jgi:class 3 adenylate cyclase
MGVPITRTSFSSAASAMKTDPQAAEPGHPGQILISPRVLMAVEKDVTVEPVGDFALKGIRRPLTAYNVLATKAPN